MSTMWWFLPLLWLCAAARAANHTGPVFEVFSDDNDTISNTTRRHIADAIEVFPEPTTGMVSADWDSDGMAVPLSNSSGRITSLEALLEVFNPQRLARQWEYPPRDMTAMCGLQVHQYLDQLKKGELWALKSKSHYCSWFVFMSEITMAR